MLKLIFIDDEQNSFAFIPSDRKRMHVRFNFFLPEFQNKEVWRDKFAMQEFAVFHWRGDEIYGAEPIGSYLKPFAKEVRTFL